jgi:hypothetical protein
MLHWTTEARDAFLTAARYCDASTSHDNGKDYSVWLPDGPHIHFEEVSHRVYMTHVYASAPPIWLEQGPKQWWQQLLGKGQL